MTTRTTDTADRAAAAFAAYRDGDVVRMADLVEAASPTMWHVARATGLDRQLAEDAVQLAWTELVAKADSVRDPQSVLAWLITTTRRAAVRLSKRQRRDTPYDDPTDALATSRSAPPAEAPEEIALHTETQRRLWQHIGRLSPRCRELLRIVAFADRPDYAAISARLGMPVGSIGPTRGRCLATLRAALADDPHWSS